MSANQQSFNVNFTGDIDTKSDPFQIAPNNFAAFDNAVRTVGGRLTKRNGYKRLGSFTSPFATNLSVFGGALLGIGSTLQTYSPDTNALYSRGAFQPVGLSVLPAIRNSATQTSCDVAVAPNGLAIVACGDSQAGVIYQIIDSVTGEVIVPITTPTGSGLSVPRAFVLGTFFVVTYCTGSNTLNYTAIPYANPLTGPTSGAFANVHAPIYDGAVNNGILYLAWNSTDSSGLSYSINTLSSSLSPGTRTLMSSALPALISVAIDSSNPSVPVIWVMVSSYTSAGTTNLLTAANFNASLVNTLGNTTIITSSAFGFNFIIGITGIALNGFLTGVIGFDFGPNIVSDYSLSKYSCSNTGTVVSPVAFIYALRVAGRPFINFQSETIYFLAFYENTYQPTYLLLDLNGNILAKLAYSNAGDQNEQIVSTPTVSNNSNTVQYGYLYQDLVSAVNKGNGGEPGGIYSQSGANVVTFNLNDSNIVSSEIGGSLQLSGGFLWMFDGQKPVENNFHVWPDPVTATSSGSGGSIASGDQPFFYQVTYEWTDASGKIHRSAPSIPLEVSGLTGSTNAITLTIPVLGFTAKLAPNPVRIVVYRWSAGSNGQSYYQVSSQSDTSGSNALTINNPPGSTVSFVDKLATTDIIGNNLLYTTGGVIEDIGAPASSIMVLFDNRLWLLDAEDPNLFWYSKQVIEGTPVEMSDLLTYYVAPSISSQASTGPVRAAGAMDDKLIIFKANAIYYTNGTGPDNTGANNQYSEPIFVTSAVGCTNQQSIVLTNAGLMFQTSQGFWILGRDLSTSYIGAPAEAYNVDTVTSALSIPNTTQVRFTLNEGIELIYDYFYQKWNTASDIAAISSVVYDDLHTYLDASGNIWQENPGSYVDGTTPVNQSVTTPWYNLAGLQGYMRAYFFTLLGTYVSPHTLTVQIYYDYEQTPAQTIVWNPNYTNPNGNTPGGSLEQEKFFFERQKCQAVKFSITEAFDITFGGTAGQGLTLSGINFTLGVMKSFNPTISAEKSAG